MARKFPLEIIINGIDKLSGPLAQMSRKLERFGNKTKNMGQSLTKGLTLPLGIVAGVSLKTAAQIESLETRFESLAGGADKAKEVVKELAKFAAQSPFELLDTGNAAASLLAAGFATGDLNKQLKLLGDIAAGAKVQLSEMTPLYTEIRLKGKAFTQDLRQFATRGIPIVAVLAKHLGVTEEKIFDLASKGKITFPLIEKAFDVMTRKGGIFENQAQKMGNTLEGVWSTFTDSLNIASASIGNAIVEATDLKENLKGLTDAANRFAGWFSALPRPMKNFIVYAGLTLAVLGPLLMVIGQVTIGLAAMAFAFSVIAGAMGAITGAGLLLFGAWVLVGVAIGTLIYQFVKLKEMAGGWLEAFKMGLLGIAVIIGDALISPFISFIRLLNDAMRLLNITVPKSMQAIENFSFGNGISERMAAQMAGNGSAQPAPVQGSAPDPGYADPRIAGALAMAGRGQQSEATVNVKFENLPQGAKVTTSQKGKIKTDVTQGMAMGTP